MLARPFGDQAIEFRLALAARVMRLVARILRPFRLADGFGEAREHLVLVGADDDVAVAARIGVGRRDAGKDRAGARAHVAAGAVVRQQRLRHLQHRFVKRAVDHLPAARLLTMMQRRQRAHAAIGGGKRVADGKPHARGRPSGSPTR